MCPQPDMDRKKENMSPEILNKITSTAELSWALLLAVWRKLPKRTIDNDVSKIKHIILQLRGESFK